MSPADESAGAQGGAEGAAGGAAGSGTPAGGEGQKEGAGAAGAGGESSVSPEIRVPDKFLVDGKPDYQKLTKSYLELEKGNSRRREELRTEIQKSLETERLENVPAVAADYEIATEFKIGDRDFTVKTDDPMLDWMKGVAHKYGIPKGEINEVIQGYVAQMVAAQPSWETESQLLGAKADARHSRVDGWLKGNLSAENYSTFARLPATAATIKAIEELMTVAGSPPVAEEMGAMPGEIYSREDLTKMLRDSRYSGVGGKIDPSFVAKVRAGFQRLNRN